MHWADNKLKKGQRRSLGATPITSSTDPFSPASTSNNEASSPQSQSIHHPTVVAPPLPSQSQSQSNQSPQMVNKSPSKSRSFFRGHGHSGSTEAGGGAHLNTIIPSPSLHMNTGNSVNNGLNQQGQGGNENEDDAALLHIRLKQEAEERAMRTSPRSSSIAAPKARGHTSNLSSGGVGRNAPLSYAYDGRDVYPSSPSSPTAGAGHSKGHGRSSSLAGGQSSIAPSSISPSSGSPGGAGGGINAGWYMTTGVLPAVIQSPPPGGDSLNRSGSLGQRSRLTKYGSLFDATGLDRSGTQRTGLTSNDESAGGEGTSPPYSNLQHQSPQMGNANANARPVSPDYVQNVSGLKSKLLDDTADATAANRSIPPFGAGKHHHNQVSQHSPPQQPYQQQQQGVSAIPIPMGQSNTTAQGGTGFGNDREQYGTGATAVGTMGLPDAVTNAAQTAQHRRNVSRDGAGYSTSPPRTQHPAPTSAPLLQGRQQQDHQDQTPHLPIAAMHSRKVPLQGTEEGDNQGRFQEEMGMIGRKSEDAPRSSSIGMLPAALASTGPSRGDSLKNKNRGADAVPQSQQQAGGGGMSSYNRGDMQSSNRVLPAEMGESLPASEIARQRELQNAYATQGAREEPRVAASAIGISDPPAAPSSGYAGNAGQQMHQGQSRALPRQETVNTATQGPSYQTTRVSEPKVVSQKTQSYLDHPLPNISFPAPNHPHINELFGNIAQSIPHYMFVNYTASVCQECVESEKKMFALTHGGEKWRYTYSDPAEEKEIPSDDVNTRKTGREDFKDEVSLLSSGNGTSSYNKDGKGPCKCEECLKNREIVKFAAENGLIEKIFEGRRHTASELIETITTTTIVRAPIIRETITTIWCEEPNCMQCAVKQKEFDEAQRLKALEKAMNGMVIHETGGDHYTEYKNLLNVNGARGGDAGNPSTASATTSNSKTGLDRLLKIAGNPRQEKMRRMPGTTAEFDGHIVGFDDEEIVGKSIEEIQPSNADMAEFVKSGGESRV